MINKYISSPATILAFFLGALMVGSRLVFGFTEPTQTPPLNNVPAPLNVSNTGQSKAGGLILNTGGAANGLIVQLGNVGIRTVNPAAALHVAGDLRVGDNQGTTPGAEAFNNSLTLWGTLNQPNAAVDLKFKGPGLQASAIIRAINELPGGTIGLAFLTSLGNELPTEKMRIDHSGNVGIGTVNPTARLDVQGQIRATEGISIYRMPKGCLRSENGLTMFEVLTTASTCLTGPAFVGNDDGHRYYHFCDGSAGSFNQQTCPNSLVGRMVAP